MVVFYSPTLDAQADTETSNGLTYFFLRQVKCEAEARNGSEQIFRAVLNSQPHRDGSFFNEITQLLAAWGNGDQRALDQLMPLVYSELHRLAHRYIKKERPGHTLQTSALLNEAFLRLVDQRDVTWKSRAHFFAISAQMMRRILVDYARTRGSVKRAGKARQVSFDEQLVVSRQRSEDVLELHNALNELAVIDERKSKVVELKFFGGLSIEETAEVLGVSPGTVMRDWTLSKAWLRLAMSKSV